jgi:sterol 3beta-glucosyltransferase
LRAIGTAPSWTPSPTSTIVAEPESYAEERDDSLDLSDDSSSCDIPSAPASKRSATDAWKLEPAEVIRLIIDEFGPIAPDGEEEKLLLETDGGIIKDISIIGMYERRLLSFVRSCPTKGVIHVTTHRLTFHASLMAANPDAQRGVIRSGTVVIHRKGWRSKRRLWLELSHDMMCTYASSRESDKIRPIRTVLCMFIARASSRQLTILSSIGHRKDFACRSQTTEIHPYCL